MLKVAAIIKFKVLLKHNTGGGRYSDRSSPPAKTCSENTAFKTSELKRSSGTYISARTENCLLDVTVHQMSAFTTLQNNN